MVNISTLTAVLAVAVAMPLQAQQRGGRNMEQRIERLQSMVDSAIVQLGLEGDVADQFRDIMAADIEQRRELFESVRGNPQAMASMREGMQELDETTSELLSEILTKEQLATFDEMRTRRPGRAAGQRGRRPN